MTRADLAAAAVALVCLITAGPVVAEPSASDGPAGPSPVAVGPHAALAPPVAAAVEPPAESDAEPELPAIVFTRPAVRPLDPSDLPPASVFAPLRRFRHVPQPGVPASRLALGDRTGYRAIAEREARAFDIPPELADAVMAVESGYNSAVVGADGEIGLMQLMPPTARMLGFAGTLEELAIPEINIHYGVRYLAGAWRLGGKDICTAAMKYRAGHGETRFSYRSVDYCVKVRAHLAARGFPVVGSVPEPTFGAPGGGGGIRSITSTRDTSPTDVRRLNDRIREISDRLSLRAPR